jgi:L-ascorbate metabolism protein UlaG (beta-lactamase superfamily)
MKKIIKIIGSLIGVVLLVMAGLLVGYGLLKTNDSASRSGKGISDHYNGSRFFNPTLLKPFSPGFSDFIKMAREERPAWPDHVDNEGVHRFNEELEPGDFAVTFVNHATFLLQTSDLNILTDPVWSERASPFSWVGPKRVRQPGVRIDDLPRIDVILISHNHYDHLDVETLKKLNERFSPTVIVPFGDKDLVESIGLKKVFELDWWESIQSSPVTSITFTPSQHDTARGLRDRDKSLWGSYFIRNGDGSIYFGGDGGYSTHFVDIRKRMGSPKIALLGIGAYAPQFFMKPIHMNPAEAVAAHNDLGATVSIGMHFGTFHLSSEKFEQPTQDLADALYKMGVSQSSFITIPEGETKVFRH